MLSGRLNYRCQVFPGTVSRTLYAGVADTQRRRGGAATDCARSGRLRFSRTKALFFPVSREFPLERSSRLSASTAKTQNRYHRLL